MRDKRILKRKLESNNSNRLDLTQNTSIAEATNTDGGRSKASEETNKGSNLVRL